MKKEAKDAQLEAVQSLFLECAALSSPYERGDEKAAALIDSLLSLATKDLPALEAIEAKLLKTAELLSYLPSALDEEGRLVRTDLQLTRKELWSVLTGLLVGPDRIRTHVICMALLNPVRLTRTEESGLAMCIRQASIPKNRAEQIAVTLYQSHGPFQEIAYQELEFVVECYASPETFRWLQEK